MKKESTVKNSREGMHYLNQIYLTIKLKLTWKKKKIQPKSVADKSHPLK